MPVTNFDALISDMNAGLALLAEQRGAAPIGFATAWRHANDLARDGVELQRSVVDSRRRAANSRALAAEVAAMSERVAASSVATREVLAAARRDRLRTGMKSVMAKAMSLFRDGQISGDQVRQIKARTNRLGQALWL